MGLCAMSKDNAQITLTNCCPLLVNRYVHGNILSFFFY